MSPIGRGCWYDHRQSQESFRAEQFFVTFWSIVWLVEVGSMTIAGTYKAWSSTSDCISSADGMEVPGIFGMPERWTYNCISFPLSAVTPTSRV
jgi:hypothetical protein